MQHTRKEGRRRRLTHLEALETEWEHLFAATRDKLVPQSPKVLQDKTVLLSPVAQLRDGVANALGEKVTHTPRGEENVSRSSVSRTLLSFHFDVPAQRPLCGRN